MILIDTNILIHSNLATSPHYSNVTAKLLQFAQQDEELAICPQVLYEFYVVATRPETKNGLGIANDKALEEIDRFMEIYTFIEDPLILFNTWLGLMKQYGSLGKTAHDGRIFAFMQAQAIENIYTLNPNDFNRYTDIISVLQ